jgi:hypothetical protein
MLGLMTLSPAVQPGRYEYKLKYDRGYLILKKDGRFEQRNSSCTWNFIAKGRWAQKGDTIILRAGKMYSISGLRGRQLEMDTTKYPYPYFQRRNRYVLKYDTLYMLYIDAKGIVLDGKKMVKVK